MRGWSSKLDLLEGSVARNFAHLESTRARNGWGMSHKNMGWKLRLSTLEICLLHHESLPWTMGSPNAAMATVWKRTCWTSSNALGKQIRTVWTNQTLVWLERHGCKRGAMDGRGGRFWEVLYSVAVFFSHLFSHWFAPSRELPCRHANLRPQTFCRHWKWFTLWIWGGSWCLYSVVHMR